MAAGTLTRVVAATAVAAEATPGRVAMAGVSIMDRTSAAVDIMAVAAVVGIMAITAVVDIMAITTAGTSEAATDTATDITTGRMRSGTLTRLLTVILSATTMHGVAGFRIRAVPCPIAISPEY